MFDGPNRFLNSEQCTWWNRVGRLSSTILLIALIVSFLLYSFVDSTLKIGSDTAGNIASLYRVHFWTILLAFSLIAYSTLIVGAIAYYKKARLLNEDHLIWRQIKTASGLLGLYVVVFSIYLPLAGLFTSEFITAAVVWITISVAILGWIISYQITSIRDQETRKHTAITERKNHTLNVLLQSRISDTFQQKLEKANSVYPRGANIPLITSATPKLQAMLKHPGFITSTGIITIPGGQELDITDDDLKQAKAIEAIIYILNYYEFLSVGVTKDDIDEKLLYECLSGIFKSLNQRSKNLIDYSVSIAGEGVFEHFTSINASWDNGRYLKTGEQIVRN